MGYSEKEDMVRVDFFKEGGKWYCTEAVRWTGCYRNEGDDFCSIHDAFKQSLRDHLGGHRLSEMIAVCLEPYHEHSHPIMIKVRSIWEG
jgi:hypothetical protein